MENFIFDYRPPAPALREYVRQLQIIGCKFPASMPDLPVKAYWPRAENSLAFFPKDAEKQTFGFEGELIEKPRSVLNGQYCIVTNRHVGHDFLVFQVQFQPGALFRLTGIPAHELTNSFVDAEAVFSPEIRLVNERLSYTRHYTEMIPIVESFLLYLVRRSKIQLRPIDRVSQFLLQQSSVASLDWPGLDWPGLSWPGLDWLADQACLSQRQFYRQFVAREGISPKLFARIARFETAVKYRNAHPAKDWLSVALDLGYYDYQHLVRDFKEFTSLTPNGFLREVAKSPEQTFGKVET